MEENKKYHLDENDTIEIVIGKKHHKLYRIVADCEIENPYGTISKGQKGGYIYPNTLATDDVSWVADDAILGPGCFVCSGAFVCGGSILLHDVRVAGKAYVKDTQINSKFKSNIEGDSLVVDSYVLGDLNMTGATTFAKSKLEGTLELSEKVKLQRCHVKTEFGKISAVGGKRHFNQKIVGNGILDVSDDVKVFDIKSKVRA